MSNGGEVRMKVYDGTGRGKYLFVFAGPAHTFENGVGLNDEPRLNSEEFEFVMEGIRRNKIACPRCHSHGNDNADGQSNK